jgi:hypothetical protein
MTDTIQEPEPATAKALQGIGGWLILPVLHLIMDVLVVGLGLFAVLTSNEATNELFGPSALEAVSLIGFLLFSLLLCFYAAYCLVKLFGWKAETPILMMGFYGLLFVKMAVNLRLQKQFPDAAVMKIIHQTNVGALGGAVAAIIWVSYFRKSVRVKNTFVR